MEEMRQSQQMIAKSVSDLAKMQRMSHGMTDRTDAKAASAAQASGGTIDVARPAGRATLSPAAVVRVLCVFPLRIKTKYCYSCY